MGGFRDKSTLAGFFIQFAKENTPKKILTIPLNSIAGQTIMHSVDKSHWGVIFLTWFLAKNSIAKPMFQ